MTHEEALKVIKGNLSVAIHDNDGLGPEYEQEQVDGLKLAKEAIEKQIPTKPKALYYPHSTIQKCTVCPVCKNRISTEDKYCKHCGQALDWSE